MPLELKAKVWKVKSSIVMVIPKGIVESLGIKEGDIMGISLSDSEMIVKKKA